MGNFFPEIDPVAIAPADHGPAKSSRLLILACSAAKRPDPGLMPARDRYNGPLWQTLRIVDPAGQKVQVAFLSALYGLREASSMIPDYNTRLTTPTARAMIAGGVTTRWPRPSSRRAPDNAGIHPQAVLASLSRFGATPFGDVALVGGHLYIDVLKSFLPSFIGAGFVLADARISIVNGQIGIMRRDLRTWIENPLI